MKIVCDNCATKYSIADEKVRGKVFKIRCKKCSHIIVVKGTEGDAPLDAGAADAAPAEAEPSGEGWHVVINGEQVGPLASTEVRSKFSAGEIDAETFAWKEGFGDWQRLASIDEFRDLQAAPPAADMTRRSGSPTADDLFGGGETTTGNNDLFGSPSADLFAGSASPAAAAPAPAAGAGLFAQPAAVESPRRAPTPGFGSPAIDTAPPAQAAAPAQAAGGKGLTGQRNENSVLFSLNNLQALASGGPANKPSAQSNASSGGGGGVDNRPGFANSQTEGSGLIDIRAMAAATLSSPSPSSSHNNNDIPSYSSAPVFSPIAAPILMPAAASGPPKWLWPVVGVGGLAFFAMMAVLFVVLTKKPEPVAVAPVAPVAAAPVAAAPVAAAAPAPGAAVPAATAPVAGTPAAPTAVAGTPAAAAAHTAKNSAPGGKGAKVPGTKVAKADSSAPAAAAPEPAAPAPTPKKKSSGGDDLDSLLNGATGSSDKPAKASHESAPAASDENLPEQLGKQDIMSGMGGVKDKVSGCFHQFNVPGMAPVAVTIAKSGHVASANVTGAFAGTPTGDCVAKAVKSASFPKFKGAPQSITYPFMLR